MILLLICLVTNVSLPTSWLHSNRDILDISFSVYQVLIQVAIPSTTFVLFSSKSVNLISLKFAPLQKLLRYLFSEII